MRSLFLTSFMILVGSFAYAQERLALVVGIDNYENIVNLQKARNDAHAVSAALGDLGFSVTTLIDSDRRSLSREIATFSGSIRPGDEVVFFFAGHGVDVNGRNYLLPADVPEVMPGEEEFLIGEIIATDRISANFQIQGARVALLIIDACRDNPFPRQGTRSAGATGGLARMDPAEGAFILFSAGTGQTALDRLSDNDPNPNSVFTRALLARIGQEGLSLHELVREVRNEVRRLASSLNHDQFPAYYDQLAGSFSFNPGPVGATESPVILPSAISPSLSTCDTARADWQVLQHSQSIAALEEFSSHYAICPIYVAAAQDRLTTLAHPQPPIFEEPIPTSLVAEASLCERLWYDRNLIFHNNSYCFQSDRARAVFDTSQCTTRAPNLTLVEQSEVARIQAAERTNGC